MQDTIIVKREEGRKAGKSRSATLLSVARDMLGLFESEESLMRVCELIVCLVHEDLKKRGGEA